MKAKQERNVPSSVKKITILDFDQTVSIQHTFSDHCLENHQNQAATDIYQLGKNHALQNVKMGVEAVLKHNDDELTAIATYHNNPAYIAGYISRILGKELVFQETLYSAQPTTAINVYTVAGIERPFLISYLPDLGAAFPTKISQLAGKNNQINFLTQVLNNKGQIDTNNCMINFYDDTQKNYTHAKELPKVNSFWVQGNNSTLSLQEQHLCAGQALGNVAQHNKAPQVSAGADPSRQSVAIVNPNLMTMPTRNPVVSHPPLLSLNNNSAYGYATGRDDSRHYVNLTPNNNSQPAVTSPFANPSMPSYGYATGRDDSRHYVNVAPNNNSQPAVTSPFANPSMPSYGYATGRDDSRHYVNVTPNNNSQPAVTSPFANPSMPSYGYATGRDDSRHYVNLTPNNNSQPAVTSPFANPSMPSYGYATGRDDSRHYVNVTPNNNSQPAVTSPFANPSMPSYGYATGRDDSRHYVNVTPNNNSQPAVTSPFANPSMPSYGYATGRDDSRHYVNVTPNNNPQPAVTSPFANPSMLSYGYATGRDDSRHYVNVAPSNNPKPAVISPVLPTEVIATQGIDLSGVRVHEKRRTSDNVSCTEISCPKDDQANFIMMELKGKGINVLQAYTYNNFCRIKIASNLNVTAFINNLVHNHSRTSNNNRVVSGGDFFNTTNRNNTPPLEGIVNPLRYRN